MVQLHRLGQPNCAAICCRCLCAAHPPAREFGVCVPNLPQRSFTSPPLDLKIKIGGSSPRSFAPRRNSTQLNSTSPCPDVGLRASELRDRTKEPTLEFWGSNNNNSNNSFVPRSSESGFFDEKKNNLPEPLPLALKIGSTHTRTGERRSQCLLLQLGVGWRDRRGFNKRAGQTRRASERENLLFSRGQASEAHAQASRKSLHNSILLVQPRSTFALT